MAEWTIPEEDAAVPALYFLEQSPDRCLEKSVLQAKLQPCFPQRNVRAAQWNIVSNRLKPQENIIWRDFVAYEIYENERWVDYSKREVPGGRRRSRRQGRERLRLTDRGRLLIAALTQDADLTEGAWFCRVRIPKDEAELEEILRGEQTKIRQQDLNGLDQESESSAETNVVVVPVGKPKKESFPVNTPERVAEAQNIEDKLVKAFQEYIQGRFNVEAKKLRKGRQETDLFFVRLGLIIEAKSAADRELFRMAIGQLADYSRFSMDAFPPYRCGILLPEKPIDDLLDLAIHEGIEVYWMTPNGFDGKPDLNSFCESLPRRRCHSEILREHTI